MDISAHSFMDPDIQEEPYSYYAALLEQAPVYFMPQINAYVVTKYKDIQHVVAHPEIWSIDMRALPEAQLIKHGTARAILEAEGFPRDTKLTTDPPRHTGYRAAVRNAFSPQRVKAQAAFVRAAVDALIAAMPEGGCEFMAKVAWSLPIQVITRLLGLPFEDADRIKHWSDVWVEPLTYGLSEEREIVVAREEVALQKYLVAHMELKREEPAEDILSDLAHAKMPDGSDMSLADKVGLAEHLIVGGHETATSALGAGMAILAERPEIATELRLRPHLIENFVEEVLRLESPSQGFFRVAVQDAELCGVRIPKGAMVHLRFAAANRDPEQFPDPDRLDLERANAKTHLAFSQGVHHCLGSPYARLELNAAFRSILERLDDITLAQNAKLAHLPGLSLRTLKALPVTYRRRTR